MSQTRYESPEDETDLASALSVASTANDLVLEYGRRYPNYRYGSQHFPRGDELAVRNERALHALMLHINNNKLYMSKLESPRNVLDVRTGLEGLWTKNMSDMFVDAQITGLDVIIPSTEGQQNLIYILQDYNDYWILNEVTQAHGSFDFIYARSLFAGSHNYPAFYQQCFENLEPGGYFEQSEVVPNTHSDDEDFDSSQSIVTQISNLGPILGRVLQTDYQLGSNMKLLLEGAGFVDVVEHIHHVPWSPWKDAQTDPFGHETGRLGQRFFETGIQGWLLHACIKLGLSPEQIDRWCETAFAELNRNENKIYSHSVTVTARKPLD